MEMNEDKILADKWADRKFAWGAFSGMLTNNLFESALTEDEVLEKALNFLVFLEKKGKEAYDRVYPNNISQKNINTADMPSF